MDAEGLLASAAINLGLALVALSLFSLLKKQPGNAPVYRPRRMAIGDLGAGGGLPLGHGRLTPSFRWISAAFQLSEEDVLRRHGLDALVVVRLFKFGIKCFSVCSIVGLLVLAPTNYTSEGRADIRRSNSMELFTVTNLLLDEFRAMGAGTSFGHVLAPDSATSMRIPQPFGLFSLSTVSVHILSNVDQEKQALGAFFMPLLYILLCGIFAS